MALPASSEAFTQFDAAIAPRAVVRLVVQVRADHREIVGVALRQHLPVRYPLRLTVLGIVPQAVLRRAGTGLAAMMIEDDLEADLVSVLDDLVHDLQAGETLEIGIERIVDAARDRRSAERRVGA